MLESGTQITPENHAEWLAERASIIGASDAYGVIRSPVELWMRKTGRLPPIEVTESMTTGLLLEETVVQEYLRRNPATEYCATHVWHSPETLPRQVFVRHGQYPFLTATLDLWVGYPVEVKVVGRWMETQFGEEDSDEIPERYLLQAQHQMMVTATRRNDLFAFMAGSLSFRQYHIKRNDDLTDALLERELAFHQSLVTDEPPDLTDCNDPKLIAALYREVDGWVALGDAEEQVAERYKDLGDEINRFEKEKDECRALLLKAMGDCKTGDLPSGRSITRTVVNVKAHEVKASSQVRLTIKEPR